MAQIQIDLIAETRKALDSIQNFAKKAEDSLNRVAKASNGLFQLELIKTAGAAFQKLGGFLAESVTQAIEAEKAFSDLKSALQITGLQDSAESFRELADEIQRTTKFEDDAIIKNIAYLASVTNLNEQGLKQATKSSVDLAAATGKDLGTAFQIVSNAANGKTAALKKLGVEFQKGKTEAETFKNILDGINKSFGGRAAGEVNTFEGAITRTKNAFSEVRDVIGGVIISNKSTIGSIKELGDVFFRLADVIVENQDAFAGFIAFGVRMFSSLVALAGAAIEVISNFDRFKAFMLDIVRALALLVTAVYDTASAIPFLGKAFEPLKDLGNRVVNSLNQKIDALRGKADQASVAAKGTASALKEVGNNAINKLFTDKAKQDVEDITAAVKKLTGELKKIVSTPVENLNRTLKEERNLIIAGYKQGIIDRKEYNEALLALDKKRAQEQSKILESAGIKKGLGQAAFKAFGGDINKATQPLTEGQETIKDISSLIGKGAAGAQEAVSGVLKVAMTALLGPLGQALGPIVDVLAQGPEKAKQFITEFVTAIPTIIENIILAIPALIQGLIEALPTLIQGLIDLLPTLVAKFAEQIPQIITAFANAMPKVAIALAAQAPFIAVRIATEFIKQIPNMMKEIGKGLVDAVKNAFGSIFGGGGEGGGGILSNIPIIGGLFAQGGLVPEGFPNDSFPARLTSGELVIDRSTTGRLLNFLDRAEAFTQSQAPQAQQQSGQSQTLTINNVISEEVISRVILDLNRRGFRLA